MAIKDIRSSIEVRLALVDTNITSNTTTTGSSIDTSQFELGLMFAVDVRAYTDGTYTFSIETADDTGFTVNLTEIKSGRKPVPQWMPEKVAEALAIPAFLLFDNLPETETANVS